MNCTFRNVSLAISLLYMYINNLIILFRRLTAYRDIAILIYNVLETFLVLQYINSQVKLWQPNVYLDEKLENKDQLILNAAQFNRNIIVLY